MTAEEEARKTLLDFYQALDDLLLGKRPQAMVALWDHGDHVSTVHPFGHWARGWSEVRATWEEVGAVFSFYLGHRERRDGIGTIHDLQVVVRGSVAYSTGRYKSLLYLPEGEVGLSVNCTNVLVRNGERWMMAHHHPDQAPPEYQAAIARLLQ